MALPAPPAPAPAPAKPKGSISSAINWMGCLAILLFWLPVAGPFIAGLVGGRKAGSLGRALIAVFLPGVLLAALVAIAVTWFTHWLLWGALAGLGGLALSFLNIGPLLLGAVVGGLLGQTSDS